MKFDVIKKDNTPQKQLWFVFDQNNSGGTFIKPLAVIVRAATAEEANRKAEEEGTVYFDGCENGQDCECCGDRWSRQWKGDNEPDGYSIFATLEEAQKHVIERFKDWLKYAEGDGLAGLVIE